MIGLQESILDGNLPVAQRIQLLAKWIDESADSKLKADLAAAISVAQALLHHCADPIQVSMVNYYIANAYSAVRVLAAANDKPGSMPWEDEDLEQELVRLRIAFATLKDLPLIRDRHRFALPRDNEPGKRPQSHRPLC